MFLLRVPWIENDGRRQTISVFHPKATRRTSPALLVPFVFPVPWQADSGDARGIDRLSRRVLAHLQVGRDRLSLPHLFQKERGACVMTLIAQITRPIWRFCRESWVTAQ